MAASPPSTSLCQVSLAHTVSGHEAHKAEGKAGSKGDKANGLSPSSSSQELSEGGTTGGSASASASAVAAQNALRLMGNGNQPGDASYSAALGRGVQYCRFFRNMLGADAPVALSQQAGRFFMEEVVRQCASDSMGGCRLRVLLRPQETVPVSRFSLSGFGSVRGI